MFKKVNLLTQILIAFVVAIILGLIFGESINVLQPLGDLFLRLIKFIIVPLILSSLIIVVASTEDPQELGRIGGKTILYYLVTTGIFVAIVVALSFIISPVDYIDIDATPTAEVEIVVTEGIFQILLNIIPENPFAAFTEGDILQIIFFAIFVGLAITLVGKKADPVYHFFDGLAEIMYKITGIVM